MATIGAIHPIKRFWQLLRVDRAEITSIYFLAIFNGLINLTLPLGIQAIINLIGSAQYSTSWVVLIGIVIFGVIASGALQIMQARVSENIQQKIFTRAAFDFGYRIPRIRLESVDKTYLPELVNRFFDTLSVQKGLSKILLDFSSASLQILFGLIVLSFYHPFFIAFGLILVAIFYAIFRLLGASGLRTSLDESKYKYEVAHWLEELARNVELFKLAGTTPLPLQRVDEDVSSYLKARRAHFRVLVKQYWAMISFKVLVTGGLLILGGILVIEQQMNIGQFVASEIIILQVVNSVEKLIMVLETVYDVLTSLEKMGTVTDMPLEDEGTEFNTDLDASDKGMEIRVEHLGFRFEESSRDTLRDISFSIQPGERICLVGGGGSGKSTLLHLLGGMFDAQEGSIFYDNQHSRTIHKEGFRTILGSNLLRGDIFRASFYENISLGRPHISQKDIQHIVRDVGLEQDVSRLPRGYSTELVPGSGQLSRSGAIRLMLARALVGNPRLVLLEDTMSLLPPKDRRYLLDYILSDDRDFTLIAVSQQVDTIRRFDRIIGLDNGKVRVNGSFDEIEHDEWFANLFLNRLD